MTRPRDPYIGPAIVCVVVALMLLVFGVSGAHCQESTPGTTFKLTAAALVGVNVVDTVQTAACVQAKLCTEQNPTARWYADKPWALATAKAAATTAVIGLSWRLYTRGHKRAAWLSLGAVVGAQTAIVLSNAQQLRRGRR